MATATAQSDFFDVQLSPAALKALGPKAQVRITGLCGRSHFSYIFAAGVTTRVLTSEWRKTLSKKTLHGELVLELAPAKAGAPAPAAKPAEPSAANDSTKGGK